MVSKKHPTKFNNILKDAKQYAMSKDKNTWICEILFLISLKINLKVLILTIECDKGIIAEIEHI